jgi:hypothetical protein
MDLVCSQAVNDTLNALRRYKRHFITHTDTHEIELLILGDENQWSDDVQRDVG